MQRILPPTLALLAAGLIAGSGLPSTAHAEGACATIVNACKSAGFRPGGGRLGGLWFQCVDPIINQHPQPASAVGPLPNVDQQTINQCKTENPDFAKGRAHD